MDLGAVHDPEVLAREDRKDIGTEGSDTEAIVDGVFVEANTNLVLTVPVRVEGETPVVGSLDEELVFWWLPTGGSDSDGSVVSVIEGTVGGSVETTGGFGSLEEGQDVGIGPARDAPRVVVETVSSDPHQSVDDASTTESLSSSNVALASIPVEDLLSFVEVAIVQRREGCFVPVDRDLSQESVFLSSSSFDEKNRDLAVGRESVGEHAASSTTTNDDEVEVGRKVSRFANDW